MAKRDWRKDRKLKAINRSFGQTERYSIAQIEAGAGKTAYSQTQRQFMHPSKPVRIDPESVEGKLICDNLRQKGIDI